MNSDILFLKNKIPIRRIKEPFCLKCMNPIDSGNKLCNHCESPPSLVDDWFFNRVLSLGRYKTYENEPYNNIPLNTLSRMILIIKGFVEKNKKTVGEYLADGMFKIIEENPFLCEGDTFILIPPKDNPEEKNQCEYILNPPIETLTTNGYIITNISRNLIRKEQLGENKYKPSEPRFNDVHNIYEMSLPDLNQKNVLIIDDVSTTNATAWDISRALKEKNAGKVNILTVGRTLLTGIEEEGDFPHSKSFIELISYFSNIENFLEVRKIDKVNVIDLQIKDNNISCAFKNKSYELNIDYKNKTLYHDCNDFIQRRYKNKSFCKHITKLFLSIKDEYGEELARSKLNEIYSNLLEWEFQHNL